MEDKYETLMQCIEQLEKCTFTDTIGHPLEMNVAFIQLKKYAMLEVEEYMCMLAV